MDLRIRLDLKIARFNSLVLIITIIKKISLL